MLNCTQFNEVGVSGDLIPIIKSCQGLNAH